MPDYTDCFVVTCVSPLDDEWETRDEEILRLAGRHSNASSADASSKDGRGKREHKFLCTNFREAQSLKRRLESIPFVIATIRER
jgi:hypothetical protein